jgi:predicted DCC family thiol-disulfide oxidoreductase YuxK
MLGRLPAPWRWLRALAVIPRPLRDGAYRWIARNRYRLMGRREVCMVPTQALRARFVEETPPGEG